MFHSHSQERSLKHNYDNHEYHNILNYIPQINWSSVSVSRAMPLSEAGASHVPAMKISGGVSIRNCGSQRNSQSHTSELLVKSLQNSTIQYITVLQLYITYRVSIVPSSVNVPLGILWMSLLCKLLQLTNTIIYCTQNSPDTRLYIRSMQNNITLLIGCVHQ